ncbi:hypothetical protein DITRI_Ditri18aG0000200 [Diplodiscus trichospermus]
MLEKEVIWPRNYERQSRNSYYRYDLEPFKICMDTYGWDDPYVRRTHEDLLNWKYAQLNSVDFLFQVRSDVSISKMGSYARLWCKKMISFYLHARVWLLN